MNENVVIASVERLKEEFEKRPELEELCFTLSKDLPVSFRFLIRDPQLSMNSIYDLIERTINNAVRNESYFSERDGRLVGWFAYFPDLMAKEVHSFKMFAFDPDNHADNLTLIEDLIATTDKIFTQYDTFRFTAYDDNPASKGYVALVRKYERKGYATSIESKNGVSTYTIRKQGV